jgi:hypothetical protein
MSVEQQQDLLSYGYLLFLFVLPPLLIVLSKWLFRWRSRFARFCLATLIPGLGIETYHSTFVKPLSLQLARERGDTLYDGTGAGAAIFLVGLAVPAFIAALTLGIECLLQRNRSSSGPAPSDHSNVA